MDILFEIKNVIGLFNESVDIYLNSGTQLFVVHRGLIFQSAHPSIVDIAKLFEGRKNIVSFPLVR